MDADEIDWEWQAMCLRQHLSEIDGDAFESFFQEIGKALWGSGFQATIPMGPRGDLKCDGWRADVGYVYQCYGPRYGQADVREALKKVNEDFRGAQTHWQDLLKKWWFVVGLYRDKVPPEILRLMAQLTNELKVLSAVLHREDIVTLARGIVPDVRASKFGKAPVRQDMIRRVTYENIGRALAFIRADITQSPIAPVPLPPTWMQRSNLTCCLTACATFSRSAPLPLIALGATSAITLSPMKPRGWPKDFRPDIGHCVTGERNRPRHSKSW